MRIPQRMTTKSLITAPFKLLKIPVLLGAAGGWFGTTMMHERLEQDAPSVRYDTIGQHYYLELPGYDHKRLVIDGDRVGSLDDCARRLIEANMSDPDNHPGTTAYHHVAQSYGIELKAEKKD